MRYNTTTNATMTTAAANSIPTITPGTTVESPKDISSIKTVIQPIITHLLIMENYVYITNSLSTLGLPSLSQYLDNSNQLTLTLN